MYLLLSRLSSPGTLFLHAERETKAEAVKLAESMPVDSFIAKVIDPKELRQRSSGISLAKLRAAATISVVPEDGAWHATAFFYGLGTTGTSTTHDGAVEIALDKLLRTIESVADAIKGVEG